MTYSVYQHWDPLEVCLVGKTYPPEFYSYIHNVRVRSVLERIAEETEEDYQKLITLLELFNVEVIRPKIQEFHNYLLPNDMQYNIPPMTPRDYTAMIGDTFYTNCNYIQKNDFTDEFDKISIRNKVVYHNDPTVNSAMVTRCGRDLYFGTLSYDVDAESLLARYQSQFPNYRCHVVNTGGHLDGTFCPVKPGLIISLCDIPTYAKTFPGWEVVYLPGQSWEAVAPFLDLKRKNMGKWWVPGEELNDDFTDYVEQWMSHWVGYVEETVFDVNMLVIDEKNVVCNNYNKQVFDAFERHGITPHIVNFRHRFFWDGGLHCITSDISRRGTMQDYFPGRG